MLKASVMRKTAIEWLAGLAVLLALPGANGQSSLKTKQDVEMRRLSAESGCDLCHSLEHRPQTGNELLPIGPAWKDVGKKYRGQKDAADRLVQIVIQGSGSQDRHWSGKASGATMPPNAVEISEADAGKLVRWILSLDKASHQ